MIFLDTCIWFELLGVRAPMKEHEKEQTEIASKLLERMNNRNETIITCKEQMLELIKATEKAKMNEFNRDKEKGEKVGSGKEFRGKEEFNNVKALCKSIIDDLKHFAKIENVQYDIENVIDKLDIVDINDGIYYDFCLENNIDFYTFDSDFNNLKANGNIHILNNHY